jgi:hypothetical protein
MRRLPETDLANTAALPIGERHPALRRINLKNPIVNYRPTRRREPDIFNARGELFNLAQQADLRRLGNSFAKIHSLEMKLRNAQTLRLLNVCTISR